MDTSEGAPAQDAHVEDGKQNVESNNLVVPTNTSSTKPRKALLTRFITLSSAEDREDDMRAQLQYATKRGILFAELQSQKKEIQELVASHCGLASPDLVQVSEMIEEAENKVVVWLRGSFNVCIPIYINSPGRGLPARMGFRVPLPYKIGEEAFPGNAEKVRSEAATYLWINEDCPDIPIPKLRGFGVPGGLSGAVLPPQLCGALAKDQVLCSPLYPPYIR